MKKIFALLLIFVLMFSFAACSGKNTNDIRGDQQSVSQNSSDTQSTDAASTVSAPEFSLGNTDGLVYENKFIGIGCTLDSGWSFYTDEQIKELNNITNDLAGDAYVEAMKDANLVYDMFAVSDDQLKNMNVILEKVNPITLTSLDIAQNFENSFATMKESFENIGYTNVAYEIGEITISGKKHVSLNITAEISGIKMYQKCFAIKCNGYLANIAITSLNENAIDSIISKFYEVK